MKTLFSDSSFPSELEFCSAAACAPSSPSEARLLYLLWKQRPVGLKAPLLFLGPVRCVCTDRLLKWIFFFFPHQLLIPHHGDCVVLGQPC